LDEHIILELYIARHGETWGNRSEEERIKNGRQNDRESQLTAKGIKQAKLLGERLKLGEFDCIIASPLIRAVGTAYETAIRQKNKDIKIEILPDLFEVGTTPGYIGYPADEMRGLYPNVIPCTEEPTPAGGSLSLGEEDGNISLERARRCIAYFNSRFSKGEKVLVVAHGTFNNYLIRAALGLDNSCGISFCQENTSLTKIKYYEDSMVKLAYCNDTSHLFGMMPGITFTL
jgi:broad specificity phosphatase PhoE